MTSDAREIVTRLATELRTELVANILPYWMRNARDPDGGFFGRILQDGTVIRDADRGVVLNGRIIWTFAEAARVIGDPTYRDTAQHAYAWFCDHFCDSEFGGVYWSVDRAGNPVNRRKQTYGQVFAIYGLAGYYRAFDDESALDAAVKLFDLVEEYAYDAVNGGYSEALSESWEPLADMRLSDKDVNAPKNVNTHLHVLEAYAELYRVWPDEKLRRRLMALIRMFEGAPFLNTVENRLVPFFTPDWNVVSDFVSFGHDIEASWLVHEAAEVAGDDELAEESRRLAVAMASAAGKGLDRKGALVYEVTTDGRIDADRHWWVQAEAIVGFVNAYQCSGRDEFLRAAARVWDYTRSNIVDRKNGEWLLRLSPDGVAYDEDKVGPWKCPYHNARTCLEVIRRAESLGVQSSAAINEFD